jgi:site-specific recombinase XerD
MTACAPTIQSFFTNYLVGQRGASSHTVAAYRDTLRLLLAYAREQTGVEPGVLDWSDLHAGLVADFLTMLQQDRSNSVRTRNARLAVIHSLFRHAALRHPEHADLMARVLAIPAKKVATADIAYLDDNEVDALLAAPDASTWTGRRDHLMLVVMVTTGVRVSELTALTRADTRLATHGSHIAVHGKGRKDRLTPLDAATARALRIWFEENPAAPTAPVFTSFGRTTPMSSDAVAQRVRLHAAHAAVTCPAIARHNVTPHVTRHTCAMRMLAAGAGAATIALWLGHESIDSTRPYYHADLALKQRALDRTAPLSVRSGRYVPPDTLLAFLESL